MHMSSARPGTSHRKPTRRAEHKGATLCPDPNTSVTAGVWVVNDVGAKCGSSMWVNLKCVGRLCGCSVWVRVN